MQLRRPVSALIVAAALVGGGAALSGCVAPTDNSRYGGGGAGITQPNNDNLPSLSNRIPSGNTGGDRAANGGG